jgi:hypothetical protein
MRLRELSVLVAVLAAASAARADGDLKETEAQFTFFNQTGHGWQSVAGIPRGGGAPGDESVTVYEPWFHIAFAGEDEWTHDIAVGVDVVTLASPDAIDAMSSASAVNEALDVAGTARYEPAGPETITLRYGFHIEEPLRSVSLGAGYARRFADDNFTLAVSAMVTGDYFDDITMSGHIDGQTERYTANGNLSATQLLSPTTVLDLSYGFTLQAGTLITTWNSVPFTDGARGPEIFPDGARTRHAFSGRISQHLPATHTTLKASYRYYVDNYGLEAHTVEVMAYQYLTPWLYVRGSYRFHTQTGVDFYADQFAPPPRGMKPTDPETSDSDLAPFDAHEIGAKLTLLAGLAPHGFLRETSFDAAFYRYWRTNDLEVLVFAVSLGKRF